MCEFECFNIKLLRAVHSERDVCRDLWLFFCLYFLLCFLSFCIFLSPCLSVCWCCMKHKQCLSCRIFLAVLWGSPLRSVHFFLTYTRAHMQGSSSRNSCMLFPLKLILNLLYCCGSDTSSWPTLVYFTWLGFDLQGKLIFIDISVCLSSWGYFSAVVIHMIKNNCIGIYKTERMILKK